MNERPQAPLSGPELAAAVNRAAQRDIPTVDGEGRALSSAIQGVVLERLNALHDDRGSLAPMLDARRAFWSQPVVYAYAVSIAPGRIKGWGMHRRQIDRYCVLRGSIRVVLFDGREDSVSCGQFAQFHFTDATPGLLAIPAGVWHADQNWGDSEGLLINFPTQPYDSAAPDKLRIDPHSGIIPFDWRLGDR